MENWIEIKFEDEEYDSVWDRVYSSFNFKPSVYPEDWPSFTEPKPYITYDISDFFDSDFAYEEYHEKGLWALRECTGENEYIYALDWHHSCYLFNPWKDFVRWNEHFHTKDWPIPLFPCGDYYLFLPKDFRWGILTHPWEKQYVFLVRT